MKQKKKTTPAKKKEHSEKFSINLQQQHSLKKQPSKPHPEFIGPEASSFTDEGDAPKQSMSKKIKFNN